MYEMFKDFAGPVATIVAASAAAVITWRFGSWQARIALQQAQTAKHQADTALDQLRYNLFEKRYEIYNAAKEMLKYSLNDEEANPQDNLLRMAVSSTNYWFKLEESRFFFSSDICQWFFEIREECIKYMRMQGDETTTQAQIFDQRFKLTSFYVEMPQRFEEALKFPQLTRGTLSTPPVGSSNKKWLVELAAKRK